MTQDHNRSYRRTILGRRPPAIVLTVAIALGCRGQKPSADQDYVPVPVNPPPVSRPVRPLPSQAFGVEWMAYDVPQVMKAGTSNIVTVTFKNVSIAPWPDPDSTSQVPPVAGAVRLAYRWWPGSNGKPLAWGERADLERLLQPGQAATLKLTVTAPTIPGDYRLQFDLVQELAAFFEDKGAARLFVPVQVR